MKSLRISAIISLAALVTSCAKVPSEVIQPHDMARLMADVHIAESVIDMTPRMSNSDSIKQAIKQSVYERHGVTTPQVDSSLAWYGRNIKYYMDVYDETIEILEQRLTESGNRIAAANALSIAGDSVDVWPSARHITFNDIMPSKMITFSFDSDKNWERGDNYTWRAKFFNSPDDSQWVLAAEYSDGSVEYISSKVGGDGWKEIKLQTDSTLTPVRIFGYFNASNRRGTSLRMDSLEMVRKRVNPEDYHRPYSVFRRKFYPENKKLQADTTATDTVATAQ